MLWLVAYKELGTAREKDMHYVLPLSFLVFAYYLLLRGHSRKVKCHGFHLGGFSL